MTDTPSAPSTLTPAETVTHFLESLQSKDLDFAGSVLDERIVYENVGLPTVRGRRATLKVLESLTRPRLEFEVQIHRTTINGNTVMNERRDALEFGPLRVQFWVCGVFEVSEHGTITSWRDYFDFVAVSRAFLRGLVGIVVPSLRATF